MAESKQLDPKYLSGLKHRTTEVREVKDKDDGRQKKKHFPIEREMTSADVLSWKDNGATVTIVTADGRKLTVDKKAKAEKTDDQKAGK
jgi:urease accessory protein UreE